MNLGRVFFVLALMQQALAQVPLQPSALPLGGLDFWAPTKPLILTPEYWARANESRALLEGRFGVRWAYGALLHPDWLQPVPIPLHRSVAFGDEPQWRAKPLAGVQFEREDLLVKGDQLIIRSVSDVQTLLGKTELVQPGSVLDVLSLLGWRSRTQFVWQLGEPTREFQWRLSARLDRHGYARNGIVAFEVKRRF